MDQEIELDLGETPLAVLPLEEPGDPAASEQAAANFMNSPAAENPAPIPMLIAQNQGDREHVDAISQAVERIRSVGRVGKMDVEPLRLKSQGLKRLPATMLSDVPTPINLSRAVESLIAEVDSRQVQVKLGVKELLSQSVQSVAKDVLDRAEETAATYLTFTQSAAAFLQSQGKSITEATHEVGDDGHVDLNVEVGTSPMSMFSSKLATICAGIPRVKFIERLIAHDHRRVFSGDVSFDLGSYVADADLRSSSLMKQSDSDDGPPIGSSINPNAVLSMLCTAGVGELLVKVKQAGEGISNELRALAALTTQEVGYEQACQSADRAAALMTFAQALTNAQLIVRELCEAASQYANDLVSYSQNVAQNGEVVKAAESYRPRKNSIFQR